MTNDATVACTPVGEGTVCGGRSNRRSGNRLVAQCSVDGDDIAAELVPARSRTAILPNPDRARAECG